MQVRYMTFHFDLIAGSARVSELLVVDVTGAVNVVSL